MYFDSTIQCFFMNVIFIMISEYQLNAFFFPRHTRYLSPLRPGLRVLPPESSVPPSSQAPSQPPPQPANQAPRLPKSNSLSLFYKKCKISFRLGKDCLF